MTETIVNTSTYIQCPTCSQFVDMETFDTTRRQYECLNCGKFTIKNHKDSRHQLICKEEEYALKQALAV